MSMVVLRHLGHAHCVLLRHLVMPTALSFSELDNSSSYNSSSFSVFGKETDLHYVGSKLLFQFLNSIFLEDYIRCLKTKMYFNRTI